MFFIPEFPLSYQLGKQQGSGAGVFALDGCTHLYQVILALRD
jgi:hypothetical protein